MWVAGGIYTDPAETERVVTSRGVQGKDWQGVNFQNTLDTFYPTAVATNGFGNWVVVGSPSMSLLVTGDNGMKWTNLMLDPPTSGGVTETGVAARPTTVQTVQSGGAVGSAGSSAAVAIAYGPANLWVALKRNAVYTADGASDIGTNSNWTGMSLPDATTAEGQVLAHNASGLWMVALTHTNTTKTARFYTTSDARTDPSIWNYDKSSIIQNFIPHGLAYNKTENTWVVVGENTDGTTNTVYRSTDDGTTWVASGDIWNGTQGNGSQHIGYHVATDNSSNFVAVGTSVDGKSIYYSKNAGVSWSEATTSLNSTAYAVATDAAGNWIVARDADASNSSLVYSKDNGDEWYENNVDALLLGLFGSGRAVASSTPLPPPY
jgi:hypothetical protein